MSEKSFVYLDRIERRLDGVRSCIGLKLHGTYSDWPADSRTSDVFGIDLLGDSILYGIRRRGVVLATYSPSFKALCDLYSEVHFDFMKVVITLNTPSFCNLGEEDFGQDIVSNSPFMIVGEGRRTHHYVGDDISKDKILTSPGAFVARTYNGEYYPRCIFTMRPETLEEKKAWYRTKLTERGAFEDFVSGAADFPFAPCFDYFFYSDVGVSESPHPPVITEVDVFVVCDFRGTKSQGAPV